MIQIAYNTDVHLIVIEIKQEFGERIDMECLMIDN